jgi:hypothetical protein
LLRVKVAETLMKNPEIYRPGNEQMIGKWLPMQPFFLTMKKFLIFIAFLILIIASEYILVNELFTDKRLFVLLISSVATVFFIWLTTRFFKKYILPGKHPNTLS